MSADPAAVLADFEGGQIEPGAFGHVEHLKVAFAMLERYSFLETCARYGRGIEQLVARAGAPEKMNVTVTLAFLSLVAERKDAASGVDFDQFIAANADLLNRDVLAGWYSKDRLWGSTARRLFLLPDVARPTPATGPSVARHADRP